MIMSHDSFTYAKAGWYFEMVSFLWRTQTKELNEQAKAGARVFDFRVRWNSRRQKWQGCHGIVDFKIYFDTLSELLYLCRSVRGTGCRILLERGSDVDKSLFEIEAHNLVSTLPDLTIRDARNNSLYWQRSGKALLFQVAVKKPWKDYYVSPECRYVSDRTYMPWNTGQDFWWNVKHFKLSTIRRWAKRHRPTDTEYADMIDDTGIHVMDMV